MRQIANPKAPGSDHPPLPYVSVGIIAWNEEAAIGPTLSSLFKQSLFEQLSRRDLKAEVICVANGCSDGTTGVAEQTFAEELRKHPSRDFIFTRVVDIKERGKANAWNQYVHSVSSKHSGFLFMMDADILIHRSETMWNMLETLHQHRDASVSVDRPCKHLEFRSKKTLADRISLGLSRMTTSAPGQLCGQLYCMRSETARAIYLPRNLSACEDGFIKWLVCTDGLTRPSDPNRIRLAGLAEHTFEAYTSPMAIFRNQKRQIIGQTLIHLLVDEYLRSMPLAARSNLAQTIRELDEKDPGWLDRLASQHVRSIPGCWRLFPGLFSTRLRRLTNLSLLQKLTASLPALAATGATLLASYSAFRTLRRGAFQYWPKAERGGFIHGSPEGPLSHNTPLAGT